MSADKVFLWQCNGLRLTRLDLALRHMVIRDIKNGEDDTAEGIRLYKKFWRGDGQNDELLMSNIRSLVESVSVSGYISNSYLQCDSRGEIIDGGHRLALFVYMGGTQMLNIKMTETAWIQKSMWERMRKAGLTEVEIATVRKYGDKMVEEVVSRQKAEVNYDKDDLVKYIIKEYQRVYGFDKKRLNGNSIASINQGDFYQSFPLLGIKGLRDTDARITGYELLNIISKKSDVLDIGCNIGFIDLSVAPFVHSITGIEYNLEASKLSADIARKLGIYNATFSGGDFKEWYKTNTYQYDIVFSFAVHEWLGIEANVYAEMLDNLTTSTGKIIFESHSLQDQSDPFQDFLKAFDSKGFSIRKRGKIKDDGTTEREWVLLEKSKL